LPETVLSGKSSTEVKTEINIYVEIGMDLRFSEKWRGTNAPSPVL